MINRKYIQARFTFIVKLKSYSGKFILEILKILEF